MARQARDAVVVITGASSGIGRATAQAFARHGASVVLAARNAGALNAAAEECERLGGQALAVSTDVTVEGEVEHLADRALTTFGRIDMWVNNASVSLFGRIEEVPIDTFEQVLRTNIMGTVHGARAAIPVFREQGRGVLVNMSSMVAAAGQPYTSAYVVSKWAIRGLSECLRMELMDSPGIHCCTVLPASIDTPLFRHAANFTGRAVKAMSPVYPPEQVAESVVGLLRRPRREVHVGNAGRALAAMRTLAPATAERMMARRVEADHFRNDVPAAGSLGNLYRPMSDSVSGGWRRGNHAASRAPMLLAGAALVAIPLAAYAWRQARR